MGNFSGLSMANPSVPDADKALWSDLVQGKPELEDSLSTNAKQMKADMYMTTFKNMAKNRQMKCLSMFGTFDACRQGVLQQQTQALESALVKQDVADRRARALFERRSVLLDSRAQ